MAADGSIVFSTDLDNKELERKLKAAEKEIERLEYKIQKATAKKSLVDSKASSIRDAYRNAIANEQEGLAQTLAKQYDAANTQSQRLARNIEESNVELRMAKERAGGLVERLDEAAGAGKNIGTAASIAEGKMAKLERRIIGLAKRVFIFSLITAALRSMRSWLGSVIKTNSEASASIAQLKGALLTLVQPILQVVIPAFTILVKILTAVVGRIAQLVSALFGTTTKKSAGAAKALNSQAKAIKSVGKEAKKASKSLAAFDEINQLSNSDAGGSSGGASGGGIGGGIEPDFNWMDGVSDELQRIADWLLIIGAGLLGLKISNMLPEALGGLVKKLSGIAIAIGGLMLLWEGMTDAWENGIDWKNAALMVGGLATAAYGLCTAFGGLNTPLGAAFTGIMLVVGGIALLITGFRDAIKNGWNLKNTFVTLAGIVGTGLGFTLLTGSIIPLVISGIMAVLTAITILTGNGGQMLNNLKQIAAGFSKFISGVFSGDIKQAMDGLKTMFKGAINLVLTVFGSFVNALVMGLNWIISKINTLNFTVPDWIPVVGGKGVGFHIPSVQKWNIPQLATGAVIPPNREFMAILGDQHHGNNIEAPEDLIRQIVREESGGMSVELLREILAAIRAGKVLTVGRDEFAKLVYSANQEESNRVGLNFGGR